jgi:uncharacterized RDD family membrane protein YckC
MASSGNLAPEDRLCRHDKDEWRRAAEVPHVFDGEAAEWVRTVEYFGPETEEAREYADFSQRFVAWFVDGVITWFASVMIASVISNALNQHYGIYLTNWDDQIAADIIKLIVLVLIGWAYEALQESSAYQATLGKRLVAIKVTDLEGRRISFGRATQRYFGKILSLISVYGYFACLVTERRQALHDWLAGTIVVRDLEIERRTRQGI